MEKKYGESNNKQVGRKSQILKAEEDGCRSHLRLLSEEKIRLVLVGISTIHQCQENTPPKEKCVLGCVT